MSKSQSAVTFGDWGKVAVKKYFKKILKHEPAVLKDKDPEELHQMRVGIRSLRSAMIGFAPAIALPQKSTAKIAGKIGKALGGLRDLDVLQLALKTEYQPILPSDEQKYLTKVKQKIAQKRKKAFKYVQLTLKGKTYRRFKQGIENWLKKPQYKAIAATKIELVLPDLLLPQVSQLLLHPGWLVGIDLAAGEINFNQEISQEQIEYLLVHNEEMLHDLRKVAKKTRYNMALFTQFYGEDYRDYLQKIKATQEILGIIQDSFVLRLFLEQVLGKNTEQYLPTLIQHFRHKRSQQWQAWKPLQHQFLELATRQKFQKTIINRVIWETT